MRKRIPANSLSIIPLIFLLTLSSFPQHSDLKTLKAQVEELSQQRNYAEAITLQTQVLQLTESSVGPDQPDTAVAALSLAKLYQAQRNFNAAEPLLKRVVAIVEYQYGSNSLMVAPFLQLLGSNFKMQRRYYDAEVAYKRALETYEKLPVKNSDLTKNATVLDLLASVYSEEGRYKEADAILQQSIQIWQKNPGRLQANLSNCLTALGSVYTAEGKYEDAEKILSQAVASRVRLQPNSAELAETLFRFADLLIAENRLAEAEQALNRSIAIYTKLNGNATVEVAAIDDLLAAAYMGEHRLFEAESLAQQSLSIREKAFGPDDIVVAESLTLLAEVYGRQGKSTEQERLLNRALAIQQRTFGNQSIAVGITIGQLGDLAIEHGDLSGAEHLLLRSSEILTGALGPVHPVVANNVSELAALYYIERNYGLAEALLKADLDTKQKVFGTQAAQIVPDIFMEATLEYAQRKPAEAALLFSHALAIEFRQLQADYDFMSEKEKLRYINTVSGLFATYFSFVHQFHEQYPELTGQMYNVVLWRKEFVGGSVASLRRRIVASRDAVAMRVLAQLAEKRTQLANLVEMTPPNVAAEQDSWRKQIEALETQANDLDRELVRRSKAFADRKKLDIATWLEVREALKPGEAAVEFVRFQFQDGSWWTNRNYYSALVLTRDSRDGPKYIFLGDSKKLEGAPIGEYEINVSRKSGRPSPGKRSSFYDSFWKPLEPYLNGATHLYVSPDGVLNQVSLPVVTTPDGTLLFEKYDLHLVSSTRDLLQPIQSTQARDAVLFGNPDFDLSVNEQRAALDQTPHAADAILVASSDSRASGRRSRDFRGNSLTSIPNTDREVVEIAKELQKQNWEVNVFTDKSALEGILKRTEHPRLLHIATHGFFLPDQDPRRDTPTFVEQMALEQPMLRSGLFFAGANRSLAGVPTPPDLDDGVLTAYEAASLNLEGTELVVLAACDTGLGQVSSGEGVFGLRRALQEAGAESVMMSMWSVPDQETRELMTLFYKYWLKGEEKHQALREAQLDERAVVKKRYGADLPYYWGAFVLVGR